MSVTVLRAEFVIAAGLAAVTAIMVLLDPSPVSPWRHLYLAPVIAGGLRRGPTGGLLAALAAVLAYAPFVLLDVERAGLGVQAGEAAVTGALILGAGALSGTLAAEAERQRDRYETLVAVQQTLAMDVPLDHAVKRLQGCLARRLPGATVGLAVRDGERLVVAGAARITPGSVGAAVLVAGAARYVADVGGGATPRRAFVVPLVAGTTTVGVLAVERPTDIGTAERTALLALGAHVGLALDNARLGALQRRFADDLADKVAAATRRLAEADRMKSEFVAIASHELRTPLTALQGFSELLVVRPFTADEVQRIGEIIRSETERLARIVSDLLDLSRLERGMPPALRRARVAVDDAITGALALFTRTRTTHRFEVDCPAPLPPLDADPDAVDRILKNLVANAVKYSPPGSRVRVCARPAAGGVEVAVEDEGDGIAAEELARVFEPYYRAPGAARMVPGAGLGLAVVKALVDAHGGTIRAESAPQRGTRMAFVLPAAS
jgi:signal transduction histidine kinase